MKYLPDIAGAAVVSVFVTLLVAYGNGPLADLIALVEPGSAHDPRGWASMVAHYGLIGAAFGFAMLLLLLAVNTAMLVHVVRLRREIKALLKDLTRL